VGEAAREPALRDRGRAAHAPRRLRLARGEPLPRLARLCAFYGSRPQFLCSSATIGNPRELAESLTGRTDDADRRERAPRGEKYFAIYNPPVVHKALGIRRSALGCARDVALSFLTKGLQTIVFAPSRLSTEVLVTYLKERSRSGPAPRASSAATAAATCR
jgi:DEAD/DEAH box helicase domain-containing protein